MMSFITPEGFFNLETHLETKNGSHLIVKPFNIQTFKYIYPEIEVHKDNPTNLYIP